jgi:hypothetical protein
MKKTAYSSGVRELPENQFLFRSLYDGTFFVNIRFMLDGDGLDFVRGYQLNKLNVLRDMPLIAASGTTDREMKRLNDRCSVACRRAPQHEPSLKHVHDLVLGFDIRSATLYQLPETRHRVL